MSTSTEKKKNKKINIDNLKVPPQSIHAEMSVLGCLLLQNDKFLEIDNLLKSEDFYRFENQLLYSAISKLISNNVSCDALTLIEYLKNNALLDDAGGESYIFEIVHNTISVANLNAYANIVYEKSVLRKLIRASIEITDQAFNPGECKITEILNNAETKIFNISEKNSRSDYLVTQKDALKATIDKIDRLYHQNSKYIGCESGFRDFDDITKGLQKKDLIIIAGRPSMGKTTFAMNIVEHVATEIKKPVLIASLEMGEDQLISRMISSMGNIEHEKVFSGKLSNTDWPNFSSVVQKLDDAKISFIVDSSLTPTSLRSYARKTVKNYGELGLIVIDYLQLMSLQGFKENRTNEITAISRELKLLAKELDVPVIVLSQLNRALEQRPDKRPTLADLRDSGAIEQDADLVCFLYRDEVYHEDSANKGKAELIIAKHRNGRIGRLNLTYQGSFMRFRNFINGSGYQE